MLDADQIAPETLRPLRRAEYERMVELGMFEDERVELLAGQLVTMSPIGSSHVVAVARLSKLLTLALQDRAWVHAQAPLALSSESEPEPDLSVVPPVDYSHALPWEAYLVIEVAESSLRKDRLVKAALYAAAGIPEYWIVDLAGRAIEVYRRPTGGAYAEVTRHGEDATLRLLHFPDVIVPIAAVLPSR